MSDKQYAAPDMELMLSSKQHRDIAQRTEAVMDKLRTQMAELSRTNHTHSNQASVDLRLAFRPWALNEWHKAGHSEVDVVKNCGRTYKLGEPVYTFTERSTEYSIRLSSQDGESLAHWTVDLDTLELTSSKIQPHPNATTMPPGLAYPTRKYITSRLKGAKISINDEAGFDIKWEYAWTSWNGSGKPSSESLVERMTYAVHVANDLRKTAWHRNRSQALAEKLEGMGLIDRYEYEPLYRIDYKRDGIRLVLDESGNYITEPKLIGYSATYHFKMTPGGR